MKIEKVLQKNQIIPYFGVWNDLDIEFCEKYAEYKELSEETPEGDFTDIDNELVELFHELHEMKEIEPAKEKDQEQEAKQETKQVKLPIEEQVLNTKTLNPTQLLEFGIINKLTEIPTKFAWKNLIFENKSKKFKGLLGIITFEKPEHLKLEWIVSKKNEN